MKKPQHAARVRTDGNGMNIVLTGHLPRDAEGEQEGVYEVRFNGAHVWGQLQAPAGFLVEFARLVFEMFEVPADPVRVQLTIDVHQLPVPPAPAAGPETETETIKRQLQGRLGRIDFKGGGR